MNKYLVEKVNFVKGLSEAVGNKVSGVESVEYVILANVEHEDWTDEFLVVNYRGGAKQARNCNGNSNAAILEELAGMVYSSQSNRLGRNDTPFYKEMLENPKLKRLI